MHRLTFFTRPECLLCDAALFVVRRVLADWPAYLELIDISSPGQERWLEAYREHIPVLYLNGREIARHRIDEAELRQLLRQAHADVCASPAKGDAGGTH